MCRRPRRVDVITPYVFSFSVDLNDYSSTDFRDVRRVSSLNELKLKLPGSDLGSSSFSTSSSFLSSFAHGWSYPRRLRADVIIKKRTSSRERAPPEKGPDRPGESRYQESEGALSARGHFDSGRPDVRVARPRKARDRKIETDSTTTRAMIIPSTPWHCGHRVDDWRRLASATRASERAGGRASERRERKLTLRSPPLPLLPPTFADAEDSLARFLTWLPYLVWPPTDPLPLRLLKLARSSEYLSSLRASERASEPGLKNLRDELRWGVDGEVLRASGPLLRAVVNSIYLCCVEEWLRSAFRHEPS